MDCMTGNYLKSMALAHEFNTFLAIAGQMRDVRTELHKNLFHGDYGEQTQHDVQNMIDYLRCVHNGRLDAMRSMEEACGGNPVSAYKSTPLLVAEHMMKSLQQWDLEVMKTSGTYGTLSAQYAPVLNHLQSFLWLV